MRGFVLYNSRSRFLVVLKKKLRKTNRRLQQVLLKRPLKARPMA
uniref:Uncharacterized protein n=1 Tax=Anguilla anguilla TaxID=7936 RepID=A0A0E9Q5Z2_ANGAN